MSILTWFTIPEVKTLAVDQYNLQNLSWQRAYSGLTGQEFLDLLIAYGYVPSGTETRPAEDIDFLKPDGVISNLHYNGGRGYLISESPAVYIGKLFKDPDKVSYSTSNVYHKSPWLIKPALEAAFYQNRYNFLSFAGLSDSRIDELSDPEPKTSSGGVSRSIIFPWGGAVPSSPIDKIGGAIKQIPWLDGPDPDNPDGATFRTPAAVEATIAGVQSPYRVVRALSEYLLYYIAGDWRFMNRDGLVGSWASAPGLWMELWEEKVIPKWDAWCSDWNDHVDDGADPLDFIVWNGEYAQSFYNIQSNLPTLAAPQGNPGGFDGANNGIVSDPRWEDTWPYIGIEDAAGNSLWHMGDSAHNSHWSRWSTFDDVRGSLFTAWEREYRHNQYIQLVEVARAYPAFADTKFTMYDMREFAGITYECLAPGTAALVMPGHGLELPSVPWYGGTRSKEFRWGVSNSPSIPADAWNAFTNCVAAFRSTQACSNKEKVFWLSAKSYNAGSNTNLYPEAWFHALMAKPNEYTFLYTDGIQESEWGDLKDILDHFDYIMDAEERVELLQPKVSYFDKYVLSTLDVGGRFISRLTPRPGTIATITDNLDGVTATITDGSSVVLDFPTGNLVSTPDYAYSGYWIEQSSLIAPGVAAGPGTTYYYIGDGPTFSVSDTAIWSLTLGGASANESPGPSDTVVIPGDAEGLVTLICDVDLAEMEVEEGAVVYILPDAQAIKIGLLNNSGTITIGGDFTGVDTDLGINVFGEEWFEFQNIENHGSIKIDHTFLLRGGISVNDGTVDWSVEPDEVSEGNYSGIYIGAPGGTLAPGDYSGVHEIGILGLGPGGTHPDAYAVTDYALNGNVVLNLVEGGEYRFSNFLIGGSHNYSCTTIARDIQLECVNLLCQTYEGLTSIDISGSSIVLGIEIEENVRDFFCALGTDENISLIFDPDTTIRIEAPSPWETEGDVFHYCMLASTVLLPPVTVAEEARVLLGMPGLINGIKLSILTQEPKSRVLVGGFDDSIGSFEIEQWVCQDAVIEYGGSTDIRVSGDFDFSGYIVPVTQVLDVSIELNPTRLSLTVEGDLTVRGTALHSDHETMLPYQVRSYWSGRGGRARESLIIDPQGNVDVQDLESYYTIAMRPIESESSIGCWNTGFRISSNCPEREDAAMVESGSGSGSNQDVIPEIKNPERVKIDRLWRRF